MKIRNHVSKNENMLIQHFQVKKISHFDPSQLGIVNNSKFGSAVQIETQKELVSEDFHFIQSQFNSQRESPYNLNFPLTDRENRLDINKQTSRVSSHNTSQEILDQNLFVSEQNIHQVSVQDLQISTKRQEEENYPQTIQNINDFERVLIKEQNIALLNPQSQTNNWAGISQVNMKKLQSYTKANSRQQLGNLKGRQTQNSKTQRINQFSSSQDFRKENNFEIPENFISKRIANHDTFLESEKPILLKDKERFKKRFQRSTLDLKQADFDFFPELDFPKNKNSRLSFTNHLSEMPSFPSTKRLQYNSSNPNFFSQKISVSEIDDEAPESVKINGADPQNNSPNLSRIQLNDISIRDEEKNENEMELFNDYNNTYRNSISIQQKDASVRNTDLDFVLDTQQITQREHIEDKTQKKNGDFQFLKNFRIKNLDCPIQIEQRDEDMNEQNISTLFEKIKQNYNFMGNQSSTNSNNLRSYKMISSFYQMKTKTKDEMNFALRNFQRAIDIQKAKIQENGSVRDTEEIQINSYQFNDLKVQNQGSKFLPQIQPIPAQQVNL